MADDPIIFAMANPDPEITPEDAMAARPDAIMATGRSDYPNQVNNVLGFPFIFRGALDVAATSINEEMKLAAAKALGRPRKGGRSRLGRSRIRRQHRSNSVPTTSSRSPSTTGSCSGRRRRWRRPPSRRGVAKKPYASREDYVRELETRLSRTRQVMHGVIDQARIDPKRIVFPEGEQETIVRAAKIAVDEGICKPILLGDTDVIHTLLAEHQVDTADITVVDPSRDDRAKAYAQKYHKMRWRRGATDASAMKLVRDPVYFGNMMVSEGDADGLLSGVAHSYPETIRPSLRIHHTLPGVSKVVGIYLLLFEDRMLFIADTTINSNPTADELAEIAWLTARSAKRYFHVEPRIAMLAYSNFGSNEDAECTKVREAVRIAHERWPDLNIEGEMHADTAVTPAIASDAFPWATIQGDANILVCPNLASANIAYKLLWRLGKAEAIGPILSGIDAPVHVLQRGMEAIDIVNMAALCVCKAQKKAAEQG